MARKVRHAGEVGREWDLSTLADRQYGVVARRQLVSMGISDRTIKRWMANGRLHWLNRGSFAVGHSRIGRRGRWLAAVLACDENAILSHRSAAALWGLARERGLVVDVTSPRGNQGLRRWEGVRLHRGRIRSCEEYTLRDEIPATSVARTLFDFAEVVHFGQLEQAWEEADRLKLLRAREIERVCERGYGRRALKPIRRLLAEMKAPTEGRSPVEQRFHAFCRAYRLPEPARNVHVLGHEVDALWPEAKLVAELDSWEYHGHRAAFERDRARDPKLLLAGYRTIRITHRRLDKEPSNLATEIRQLLNQEGRLPTPEPASPSAP